MPLLIPVNNKHKQDLCAMFFSVLHYQSCCETILKIKMSIARGPLFGDYDE
jgi:hypothetical protein